MAGHVLNFSTEFEDPNPIRSRLITYELSSPRGWHWQGVCAFVALCMHNFTLSMHRGNLLPYIRNLWWLYYQEELSYLRK